MSFAFSVRNFISSVGADAGFAAIIGLAVLVLLYFAHARETANLREEAAILTERLQQAEIKVAQLSRPQPTVAPAPAVASPVAAGQPSGLPAGPAEFLFAPAGVGAPALAAATRVVPITGAAPAPEAVLSPEAAPSPSPVPASAPAVAAGAASAAAAMSGPAKAASPTASPPATPRTPSPSPATAAGATASDAPLSGGPDVAAMDGVPAPATAAGANGAHHEPRVTPPDSGGQGAAPPRGPARPSGPGPVRPLPPLRDRGSRRSSLGRRIALAVAALAVVAGAVVLVGVTSMGNSSPSHPGAAQTTNAPPVTRPRTVAFTPSSVTVAVLNGTATNQLAHRVSAKLTTAGYRPGRLATASNQTQTTTVVAYLPGASNRNDALHVANALKLRPASVQPIDQSTQQVACPPPSACMANVVVTVGADLATL